MAISTRMSRIHGNPRMTRSVGSRCSIYAASCRRASSRTDRRLPPGASGRHRVQLSVVAPPSPGIAEDPPRLVDLLHRRRCAWGWRRCSGRDGSDGPCRDRPCAPPRRRHAGTRRARRSTTGPLAARTGRPPSEVDGASGASTGRRVSSRATGRRARAMAPRSPISGRSR